MILARAVTKKFLKKLPTGVSINRYMLFVQKNVAAAFINHVFIID